MWKSRKLRAALTIVVAILLGPWLFFRATSFQRKIQVVRIESVDWSRPRFPALRLKVATWNIAHGRGNTDSNIEEGGVEKRARIELIADKLKEINADIVLLNEVDFNCTWSGGQNQAIALAQSAGYPFYATQANLDFGFIYGRWYFGNAILSRYPIREATAVELQPVNEWEDWLVGCKRGILCKCDIGGLDRISIMGLHLESRGEAIRVKQVDQVVEAARNISDGLVIAGDLNTTPLAAPHAARDPDGVNAFEKLIQQLPSSFQPVSFDAKDTFTFPAKTPIKIIDWILLPHGDWMHHSHEVIQTELSDHLPVVSEIGR